LLPRGIRGRDSGFAESRTRELVALAPRYHGTGTHQKRAPNPSPSNPESRNPNPAYPQSTVFVLFVAPWPR
ncbi:MAG: hypothetical protein KDA80_12605, partial [Planctomycetaceae bacterium]|nr:hypothetical protein [Planctomycetaceae bacterium]